MLESRGATGDAAVYAVIAVVGWSVLLPMLFARTAWGAEATLGAAMGVFGLCGLLAVR
jgi:hypothetical protein